MHLYNVVVYFCVVELLLTWSDGVSKLNDIENGTGPKRRHWRKKRECLKFAKCVAEKIQEQKDKLFTKVENCRQITSSPSKEPKYFLIPVKCSRNTEQGEYLKMPKKCLKKGVFNNRETSVYKIHTVCIKRKERKFKKMMRVLKKQVQGICSSEVYKNGKTRFQKCFLKSNHLLREFRNINRTTVMSTTITSVLPTTILSFMLYTVTKPDVNLEEKDIHEESKNLHYLSVIAVSVVILISISCMIVLCRIRRKKTPPNLTETNIRMDDTSCADDLNSNYTENIAVSIDTPCTKLDINNVSSAEISYQSICLPFPITRYPPVPADADNYIHLPDTASTNNHLPDTTDTNIRMDDTSVAYYINSFFPEKVQNVYCNTKNISSAENSYHSNCSYLSIASYVVLPDTADANNCIHLPDTADANNYLHLPDTADANNYIHIPDTADDENYIHIPDKADDKSYMHLPDTRVIKDNHIKDINIAWENVFDNYYSEEQTQTTITNYPKTLLDTDWECESVFNQGGGQLQAENSSVKLIVPRDTVEPSSTLHILGQTHVNLQRVREILDIPADEYIVSPAAEYYMNANWKEVIRKHMIIILPHTLPPGFDQSQIVIYGFDMVNGRSTKFKIPEKCKENETYPDIYYEIDDKHQNVFVFTRHFSGVIMCYHCGKAVNCPGFLQARIYGSNLIKEKTREVQIRYEIWDGKHSIKDFHKSEEYNCGVSKEFTLLESKRLTLPSTVDANTSMMMKLQMTGNEWDMWECKKYQGGQGDIFPIEKNISIQQLVVCCHDKPFVANWVMTWKHKECPKELFECVITLADNATPTSSEPLNEPAYISNIPCNSVSDEVWNKSHNKAVDILKATLNRKQVQQICCRCDILRNQVSDIQRDGRNLTDDDFINKWLGVLSNKSSTEFPNDILKYLFEIKASTAITAMREKGLINIESMDDEGVSGEFAGPQAMEEYRRDDMHRRSPCEHSDNGEYDSYDNDKDETELKVLETQV